LAGVYRPAASINRHVAHALDQPITSPASLAAGNRSRRAYAGHRPRPSGLLISRCTLQRGCRWQHRAGHQCCATAIRRTQRGCVQSGAGRSSGTPAGPSIRCDKRKCWPVWPGSLSGRGLQRGGGPGLSSLYPKRISKSQTYICRSPGRDRRHPPQLAAHAARPRIWPVAARR
jgi:hypothetical protein